MLNLCTRAGYMQLALQQLFASSLTFQGHITELQASRAQRASLTAASVLMHASPLPLPASQNFFQHHRVPKRVMERVYRHTHHFFRTHRGQDIKQLLRRFPHEAERGVYRALFKEDLQKASNARGQPASLAALLSAYPLFLSAPSEPREQVCFRTPTHFVRRTPRAPVPVPVPVPVAD